MLNTLKSKGMKKCTPRLKESEMLQKPFIEGFTPGFFERSLHLFPKQGDKSPWINPQNYKIDKKMFLSDPLEDGTMVFE